MGPCPRAEELEAVALGHAGPAADHAASCGRCADLVREIKDNGRFLDEFLTVVESGGGPGLGRDAVPGYSIEREIRRGGQGVVYEAVHAATRRRVAIKTLLHGSLATGRQRARFEREAEIAASLRHPGIVTVYDSGRLPDGRFMLAMELIQGRPLDEWASGSPFPLDPRELRRRLGVMGAVCDAVEHAHRNGVIHRDLKPANILVDAEDRPHVLDFGIARRGDLASPERTRTGEFAGTFAYASPERVSGDPDRVDTRADVYALGVILYELLAGHGPYPTDGPLDQAIASITTATPDPVPGLNEELRTILAKALSKDRERRYQSAAALGADITHFLAGEPIDAKRDSAWYMLRKTASRYRLSVAGAAALLVLLSVFAVSMTLLARRLDHQRGTLAAALAASNVERGRLLGDSGNTVAAEDLMWPELLRAGFTPVNDRCFVGAPELLQPYWALAGLYARQPCAAALRSNSTGRLVWIGFDPEGSRVVGMDGLGTLAAWRFPSSAGRPALPIQTGSASICSADLSRLVCLTGVQARLVDVATGDILSLITDPALDEARGVLNENGSVLALAERDGSLSVRVGPSLALQWRAPGAAAHSRPSLTPAGSLVASRGEDGRIHVRDTLDGKERWSAEPPATDAPPPSPLALSPDGASVALGSRADVYLLRPGAAPLRLPGHLGDVTVPEFSRDGRLLLTNGTFDRTIRIWDAQSGALLRTLTGHRSFTSAACFSADGRLVASADTDGLIRVWDIRIDPWAAPLACGTSGFHSIRFSHDGSTIAAAGGDGTISLWSSADRTLRLSLPAHAGVAAAIAFSPDDSVVASVGYDGVIKTWATADGAPRLSIAPVGDSSLLSTVAFSADGACLATAGAEGIARLWDARTGGPLGALTGHTARVPRVVFSPDGGTIATASADQTCILWDAASRRARVTLTGHQAPLRDVAFSPDGRWVATAADDRTIRVWDATTGRLRQTFSGAKDDLFTVAFHPAGRLLLSGDRGSLIRVWDLQTGRDLASFTRAGGMVLSLDLSPDGRTLASAASQGAPELWDLSWFGRCIQGNLDARRERSLPTPPLHSPL